MSALVAVLFVAGAALTLPAAAQPGSRAAAPHGIGIRLLDASVARKADPRAQIYVDDFMRPGTSISRHVQVSDFTGRPVTLQLYAVASSIGSTGWQVAVSRTGNELTSWMRVTPSTVSLEPGRPATISVDITVPVDASKGERYATVVAELPPLPSSAGRTIRVATRVGVRVYLDVGAGGEPASDFTISTLTPARDKDGRPVVTARVTNTGSRALDLGGRLELSDGPGGLRAGPYDVQVPRTLGIGETGDVTVALDRQTPVGPWLARMTLRSGYAQHAVTGRISFPVAAGSTAQPVKADPAPLTKDRHVLVPLAIGLVVALLIGLALFWLWRRRRPHPFVERDRAPSPGRYPRADIPETPDGAVTIP